VGKRHDEKQKKKAEKKGGPPKRSADVSHKMNRDYSSFIFAKHSLQYTGRSSLGLKGTFATPPQEAQVASYISLSALAPFLRALRQLLHL